MPQFCQQAVKTAGKYIGVSLVVHCHCSLSLYTVQVSRWGLGGVIKLLALPSLHYDMINAHPTAHILS